MSCAPDLEEFSLGNGSPLDAVAREALCDTLKRCGYLRHIRIIRYLSGMWEVLADAYTESRVNPVLESLKVDGVYLDVGHGNLDVMGALGVRKAAALGGLIRGNIRTITLDATSSEDLASTALEHNLGCEGLGQSLHAHSLKAFTMEFFLIENNAGRVEMLVDIFLPELWKASYNSPLLDIRFNTGFVPQNVEGIRRLVQKGLRETYLKIIDVQLSDVRVDHFTSFVDALVSNTSVNSLRSVALNKYSEDTWRYFFNHLRDNSSIKRLVIDTPIKSVLHDENFGDLVDLLQVNFILEEINVSHTSWEEDGKKALIDEALERNKRQAGYLSVLQRQNLPFGGAKEWRVFLCGLPFAGKTQLKVTMMETMMTKSTSESFVPTVKKKSKLGRTKGIGVELLCDNEAEAVSIWDLAGQDIYRALQNLLFPWISHICVFCFVFNPFKGKSKKLKEEVDKASFSELSLWLRFVASVQVTVRILPQILVTHEDTHARNVRTNLCSRNALQNARRSCKTSARVL